MEAIFMPIYNPFELLNFKCIQAGKDYCSIHNTDKSSRRAPTSRKATNYPYSMIQTNHGFFLISRITLGVGSSGKVKIGKNISTGQLVAIKTQLFVEDFNHNDISMWQYTYDPFRNVDPVNYDDNRWAWIDEIKTLKQLGQLHGATARWRTFPASCWKNKYDKNPKHEHYRYNLKVYIFSDFFEGTTLSKCLENPIDAKEILMIMITTLEQLAKLHEQNIVHGDLSSENIIVHRNSVGKIEIHFIDFEFSGKLQNGIKKYPRLGYKFTSSSYVPPECDNKMVLDDVIPDLKESKGFPIQILTAIENLAKEKHHVDGELEGYGFITLQSDLYSFLWCMWHYTRDYLDAAVYSKDIHFVNPYKRPSIKLVTEQCQKYLGKLIGPSIPIIVEPEKSQEDLRQEDFRKDNSDLDKPEEAERLKELDFTIDRLNKTLSFSSNSLSTLNSSNSTEDLTSMPTSPYVSSKFRLVPM